MTIDFSKVITAEAKAAAAQAALLEAIRQAVDALVEATAKGKGYNSAAHCASYVASTVDAWAAEAAAFIAWRDAVWLAVFAGMDDPPEDMTPASIVAALPQIVWPGE
jgi:uncharacterized membrane protein YgcG